MSFLDKLLPQETPSMEEEPIQPTEPVEHQWQQRSVTYAAPRRDIGQLQNIDPLVLSKALLGVTTILDECLLTHELRTTELLGSPNSQLDDTLDKAEQYGPQYIARNGITFVIQRYQVPGAQGNPLPLR